MATTRKKTAAADEATVAHSGQDEPSTPPKTQKRTGKKKDTLSKQVQQALRDDRKDKEAARVAQSQRPPEGERTAKNAASIPGTAAARKRKAKEASDNEQTDTEAPARKRTSTIKNTAAAKASQKSGAANGKDNVSAPGDPPVKDTRKNEDEDGEMDEDGEKDEKEEDEEQMEGDEDFELGKGAQKLKNQCSHRSLRRSAMRT